MPALSDKNSVQSLAKGFRVLEAFTAERAVVATRVAGVPELVIPHQTGWLVESGDALALTAALREALLSPDRVLMEMARAGRALVLQRHAVGPLMTELLARMQK